jgi:hypothetical protein
MTKTEEANAEREEQRHRDKEATTKIFVTSKNDLLPLTKPLPKQECWSPGQRQRPWKPRPRQGAKTKLLKAEVMLMVKENKIMLTDLETISNLVRREWLESRQKMIQVRKA